jgi:hypothetical protein
MKLFNITSNTLEINSADLLVSKPLAALLEPERNITTMDRTGLRMERAKRELTYIYLMFDWDAYTSVDKGFSEEERRATALRDSELTEEELADPVFVAACQEYQRMQRTCYDGMLSSSIKSMDRITEYLEKIDYTQMDNNGRFVYDIKKQIDVIKSAGVIVKELERLKREVRNYRSNADERVYGDAEMGMFDLEEGL